MGVVEDFPTDPFTPSLRYAATCQVPITLPWGSEIISLGTSLSVSRSSDQKSEFKDISAFSQSSLLQSRLVFISSSGGDLTEAETSGSSSSSEHIDFSVSGQIGGSFIGASGRAKYEKHASQNASSTKSSFRTTYRSGKLAFSDLPALSSKALEVLRTSNSPHEDFIAQFGEYYVAAYMLGGSNANMLGGMAAESSSSTDISGSYTIKVAFIKKTKPIEHHERGGGGLAIGNLSAYDTLNSWDVNLAVSERESYNALMRTAEENSLRGWTLAARVHAKAEEMGLQSGKKVSHAMCERVCHAGLVVELLLMPYSGLHQYVATILDRTTQ